MVYFIAPLSPSTMDVNQTEPIMRSDTEMCVDWVTGYDTHKMKTTKERNLHWYPLGQLWVMETNTTLLILVNVNDNNSLFFGKGSKIERM